MSLLDDFSKKFCATKVDGVVQIGREFFQVSPELDETRKAVSKRINREANYAGILLGSVKGRHFRPAPALLDIIAKDTARWIVIDDKAEWLFLCGRDVFGSSVTAANVNDGLALVLNRRKEVLGFGKIMGRLKQNSDIFLKNLWDKGDFLRREMDKRSKN